MFGFRNVCESCFRNRTARQFVENSLREQLENVGGDESVDVVVWLADIDHEAEKAQIVSAFEEKIASGELPPEVIDMFQLSKDSQELDGERIREIDSAVSTLEMQDALMTKRQISAGIYAEENWEKINSLFEEGRITEDNSFVSHYVPGLITKLTKDEIYDICNSEYVEEVYGYSELEGEEDDPDPDPDPVSTFSSFQYTMTGIDVMRDSVENINNNTPNNDGYKGNGIKVGIADTKFSNPNYSADPVDYLNSTNTNYYVQSDHFVDAHSAHGSLVACIIAGQYVDPDNSNITYYGAVPNAQLYLASHQHVYTDIEYLVSTEVGVNVINASMNIGGPSYNTYSYISKWMDHIVSEHNVNFVLSAGNSGSSGVTSGHYSYNTIIVGSCKEDNLNDADLNGQISDFSSYCNLENGMYKPDLVAPGEGLVTPAFYYNQSQTNTSNSGTSFSAPVVTGAVAQLCEASPTLAVNPRMMKAVVLAGTTITEAMMTSPESVNTVLNYDGNTSYNGFNRKYGAGLLNVLNSYQVLLNNKASTFNYVSAVNPRSETRNIYLSENSLLRFAFVWDVRTYISETDHVDPENLPTAEWMQSYNITVRTPSHTVYSANVSNIDSKKICTFEADESGYYDITYSRVYGYPVELNHGLAISIQSPISSNQ